MKKTLIIMGVTLCLAGLYAVIVLKGKEVYRIDLTSKKNIQIIYNKCPLSLLLVSRAGGLEYQTYGFEKDKTGKLTSSCQYDMIDDVRLGHEYLENNNILLTESEYGFAWIIETNDGSVEVHQKNP